MKIELHEIPIREVAEGYADNAATYASVKLDGLPCRAEPVNTAKQVYRLRKGLLYGHTQAGYGLKQAYVYSFELGMLLLL